MKSMKVFLMTTLVAMAMFVVTPITRARAQNSTQVGGTASVGYSGMSGNSTNGGNASGNGYGTFGANDPSYAQGNATAAGAGTSSQKVDTNSVSSTAKSVLGTQATADGATGNVKLGGTAMQTNFDGLGGKVSYTYGGNTTNGNFTGTDAANAPLQGSGTGKAEGDSAGTLNGVGTKDVTATAKTAGSSVGSTSFQTADKAATPTVASGAAGLGALGAQSVAGDPTGAKSFAGGTVIGNAAYTGINPTGAKTAGALAICGTTNGKISGGNVSASAAVNAMSQVH